MGETKNSHKLFELDTMDRRVYLEFIEADKICE